MLMQLLRADVRAAAEGARGRALSTIFLDANWKAIRNYRLAHALHARFGLRVLPRFLSYRSRVRFAIDIDFRAEIGPGFVIRHGMGVVVGRDVRAGSRLSLHQGVTLGGNGGKTRDLHTDFGDFPGATQPVLGDNVSILTGACAFGPVAIGSNAVIGAGTLLFTDVPANTSVFQKRQTVLRALDGSGIAPADAEAAPACRAASASKTQQNKTAENGSPGGGEGAAHA
ncbi:MAG: hypothetical protein PUE41_07585 [bacterium]|nr:hypothetical protein [bacterium]